MRAAPFTLISCFPQVGAGEVTGNPLFQAFDEAIRGLSLGETTILEAKGGEWQRELFFKVISLILPF